MSKIVISRTSSNSRFLSSPVSSTAAANGTQAVESRKARRMETAWMSVSDALATTLSALYGKLLVVMGTAFPMAEVISTYIPPSFYEAYYLYLYIGSMFFLLYMYAVLIRDKRRIKRERKQAKAAEENAKDESLSDEESDNDSNDSTSVESCSQPYRSRKVSFSTHKHNHYGSFYLRMGAVAFGIGSMIYSGLEFGQYFELELNTKCHNVLLALTPATRMAFIFIQMYFIFLNNEQMRVYKHKVAARFGLMHMIGTNLSVWLNVLVQETKHEILTFYNPENNSLRIAHRIPFKARVLGLPEVPADHPAEAHGHHHHHIVARGLKGPHHLYECRRTNIIGSLVQDASPFLFPCTIEYSLICAAILYVMWKSISKLPITGAQKPRTELNQYKRSPHHYSVDCARAHKGLFVGILFLVLTIISLILFFVLISRVEFVAGQHFTGRRPNRDVHLQYVYHNRESVHHTEEHCSGACHCLIFVTSDNLVNDTLASRTEVTLLIKWFLYVSSLFASQ
nr:unnamed protein product [Callosobruchus analis]